LNKDPDSQQLGIKAPSTPALQQPIAPSAPALQQPIAPSAPALQQPITHTEAQENIGIGSWKML
jgi:hypothetical protein